MEDKKNSEQEKDDNYTRIKAASHDEQYPGFYKWERARRPNTNAKDM